MPSLFIAGCGFLGEAAAGFFCAEGWRVAGITASPESAARLSRKIPTALSADLCSAEALAAVRRQHGPFDVVLHCASSGRGGAAAYQRIYVDGCARLAETFPDAHLLFAGSTSVYAQADGEWVDESSPTRPDRETGRLLLAAEALCLAAGGCVLRLSGLYGPGRSVLLRKFLDGSAMLEEGGRRWINQIHRDDAARAILTVAGRGERGEIFNVTDDHPATQREAYGWLAEYFARALPREGPADRDRKRGWTSKRVRNDRLRSLGWEPQFPNYGVALPSLAGAGAADS